MSETISDILASQSSLLQEAAEALPFQFNQCTYPLGHIRQAVYLCFTCGETRGICSACSVSCHTDHEQLELFPKRNFRCDCATSALAHSCTLHKPLEPINTKNTYGKNFKGVFCRCGRPYDAATERETMIQCVACEDWLHESCLNLRERPPSRDPTPEPQERSTVEEDDDGASEASSSGLPPPLLTATSYDSLICSDCVRSISTLQRWAGTPGILMVVRENPEDPWKAIGEDTVVTGDIDIHSHESSVPDQATAGQKRARSSSAADEPQTKRAREGEGENNGTNGAHPSQSSPCLVPAPNSFAQKIYAQSNSLGTLSLGAGDIFLTEGWRDRWCRCPSCLPSLEAHPYLFNEEETYEPPEDPDSGLSLEELGLRALQRLPRDRAIDGIQAFNAMRDELMSHLRPFAQEQKEVTEADIRAFFEAKMAPKDT